jgi:hypothetical protein
MLNTRARNTVLQWPIYYAVPASIQDKSRYKNNGTLNNITWETRPNGMVVPVFNGVNGLISLGTPTTLNINTFTISVWIKRTALSGAGNYRVIIGSENNGYGLGINPSDGAPGDILYLSKTGVSAVFGSAFLLDLTSWHHIVCTHTPTTTIFYIDGNLDISRAYAITFTSSAKNIGSQHPGVPDSFWNGGIALFKMKNIILSASQILEIYLNQRKLFGYG